MAEVELRAVEKKYPNGTYAVKGVTFEATDGEFIVLVGPSGCGKSTTLRMIAGLEEVTGGEISIGGKIVNDLEPKDRDIAMVFQNYALYPHMTVGENISFSLRMRKEKKDVITAKVGEAAEILGITHLLDRKPKELSGGERQRVAVGRAIVRKPRVFLFDEPLSNLDAALRTQMRAELKRLQRKLGATMIYVTHDQVEAMTMGDKIVVMNKGVVEQFGTPSEIYGNPHSVFVARFLGAPPMNILNGIITNQGGATRFRADGVELELAAGGTPAGKVSLGIRPESVRVRRPSSGGGIGFAHGKLVLVEPIGSVTHYYMASADAVGGTLVASQRHSEDSLADYQLGESVEFEMPSSAVQLFDASTGKKL